MFSDNDILGRPRTTRYWVVYPKDYQPGDGYYIYRFKKDAVGKAKALGNGAELFEEITQLSKDGRYLMRTASSWTYVG